jgi:hypothetical protein
LRTRPPCSGGLPTYELVTGPVGWNLGSSRLDPNPSHDYRPRVAEHAQTSRNLGVLETHALTQRHSRIV